MANPGAELDAFLRQRGSPLAGQGRTFVSVGKKYGIDPKLLVAITGAESQFGKQVKAGTFNPFGWGPHRPLGSWEQGIETVGRGLKKGYFDQGLTTPEQIGRKWAPVGAGNDPTNLNQNWAGNVNQFLQQLDGQAVPTQTTVASSRPPVPSPGRTDRRQAALAFVLGDDLASLLAPPGDALSASAPGRGKTLRVKGRSPKQAQGLVELAKSFIGTPYSWGGGGPGGPSEGFGRGKGTVGFDCSSFLQFLAAKQGKQIPRVTYDQWKSGQAVSKEQLQVGDAVFFNMGGRGPEHVGMYVGGGKFIEAPRTGLSIRVSKLAGRKDFVGARRLF